MPSSFVPREAQAKILEYTGGYMGISAVPGSGKTFTLSLLASKLVSDLARTSPFDDREVLVVTFTNNAVDNFQNRIASFLREESGLLPGVGYRVRTLHGLAHDIVRERPALAGLSEDFAIVDERTADDIIEQATTAYLRANPDAIASYIKPEVLRQNRNLDRRLQQDSVEVAKAVIRTIKDSRLDFHMLRQNLRNQSGTWPLLEMGLHIYADYQRSLDFRGAVDFSDLIALSLRVLESDTGYLNRLQDRWPYVLEDEAQDSSSLQERLLRMLTERHGNWVRVGDPNQAINTTFTTASTKHLKRFIIANKEQSRDLPESGRCAQPIIDAANYLIDWSRDKHPHLPKADALALPHIHATKPGDPQPNPPANESRIHLHNVELTPDAEIDALVRNLEIWLPDNGHRTAAILAHTGYRISHIGETLQQAGIPIDDSLLRTNSATREATHALAVLLQYLARPDAGSLLAEVWKETWWPYKGERLTLSEDIDEVPTSASDIVRHSQELPEPVRTFGAALTKLRQPEDFLFPAQTDWLDILTWMDDIDGFRDMTKLFQADMQRWTQATILPVDELLLTVGNDLFMDPALLALTHHLAVLLSKLTRENETWRLPELARELQYIAENRRKMPDFTADADGYEAKPGVVSLATMHGAKGLEWDRVYVTEVNNYNYPSGDREESYRGQAWYARDNLNLVAETLGQIEQLAMGTLDDYVEGEATAQARLEVAAERLRLLYVGVTRARRELIITYNTGRFHDNNPQSPAAAFQALVKLTAAPE